METDSFTSTCRTKGADYLVAEGETLEQEEEGGKKERREKGVKTGQMKNVHKAACGEDFTTDSAAAVGI